MELRIKKVRNGYVVFEENSEEGKIFNLHDTGLFEYIFILLRFEKDKMHSAYDSFRQFEGKELKVYFVDRRELFRKSLEDYNKSEKEEFEKLERKIMEE